MSRETMVCETCWSEDVSFRASAYWSVDKQEYELGDIDESDWCRGCDSECRTDSMSIDEGNRIKFPPLDEVIESDDPLHMLAVARADTEESDLLRIFNALLDGAHTDALITFASEFEESDLQRVEDYLVKGGVVTHIKDYMEQVPQGNTVRLLGEVIRIALESKHPGILEDIVRDPSNSQQYPYDKRSQRRIKMPDEEMLRAKAVFKLLGGTFDVGK